MVPLPESISNLEGNGLDGPSGNGLDGPSSPEGIGGCQAARPSSSSLLLSSLELSDTTIYEPEIRALLGTSGKTAVERTRYILDRQDQIMFLPFWSKSVLDSGLVG